MSSHASKDKQLEWKSRIEQQQQSGLSIKQWCLQEEINVSTFYYWKDKLFPKKLQQSSFTELKIKSSEPFILQTQGLCIRIGRECDPKLRRQLFALFVEEAC